MEDPKQLNPKSKPEPIQNVLSKKYEALAAKLGDLSIKKKKILKAIAETEEEILSLDSLSGLILAAERNGVERAMSDYKAGSQGRKEAKTYEHEKPSDEQVAAAKREVKRLEAKAKKAAKKKAENE